jgi:hypothetical protein
MTRAVSLADISIFRSAVTNVDGSVNVGYLTMYVVVGILLGAVPLMILGAYIEMWFGVPVLNAAGVVVAYTHEFKVSGLGAGIGFAAGGLATSLGAIALFLKADATPAPVLPPAPSSDTNVNILAGARIAPQQPAPAEMVSDVVPDTPKAKPKGKK